MDRKASRQADRENGWTHRRQDQYIEAVPSFSSNEETRPRGRRTREEEGNSLPQSNYHAFFSSNEETR